MTQGKVGDLTWRALLWRSLQDAGRYVDFVGPHTGLFDPETTTYDSPGYADPEFDQDHAAWWGLALSRIDQRMDVRDTLATYRPDVVIDDLGINDLAYYTSPTGLIALQRQFVADVRAANPRATVILGQLTQTWHRNRDGQPVVEQYNELLLGLAAELDRSGARVLVAARPGEYVKDVDTYDPAHPSPAGEIKLADQFAAALAAVPLPGKPAPPTPPAPTYAGAAKLSAAAKPRGALLTFTTPEAATSQTVWKRDLTRDGRWVRVTAVRAGVARYRVQDLRPRHRYAFRLRAARGALQSTDFSNRVVVRVRAH